MPSPLSSPAGGAQGADMYLHVQAKRAGKVKGEAVSPNHVDDIVVKGWGWGIQANTAMGSTEATSRRSYTALTVTKQVDCASTALMSALVTNDEIKEAVLTMRRTGGDHEAFFTVTLKNARVTRVDHSAAADGGVVETLAFTFTDVTVEYRRQQATGIRGGGYVFTDQLPAAG
jgi:type VI secretion system secreted protein Hcp